MPDIAKRSFGPGQNHFRVTKKKCWIAKFDISRLEWSLDQLGRHINIVIIIIIIIIS